jgi:protoporphyrinogen IX oxidase
VYLWVKAFHIIAVISWMAGLLYLPRLFVYHTMAEPGGEAARFFEIMERRLLKAIMTPAMLIAWILGLYLVFGLGAVSFSTEIWFQLKLGLLIVLTAYHFFLSGCVKTFASGANTRSTRFYRIINEVPTIVMILVVCLVIFRPF